MSDRACRVLAALAEDVKACGAEALELLGQLKEQGTLGAADGTTLRAVLRRIHTTAEVSLQIK